MKSSFIVYLLTLASFTSYSQVFTGGNVSISYENGIYADIAPIIGYGLEDFRAGVSPIVSYRKSTVNNTSFSYGARIFGQYSVIENAFVHAEFQAMNSGIYTTQADGTRTKQTIWAIALPVGAGYEYKISEKAYAQVSVLYDLLQDKNSPNRMPVIRAGIRYDL